jgi:hypothetical protein
MSDCGRKLNGGESGVDFEYLWKNLWKRRPPSRPMPFGLNALRGYNNPY